MMENNFWMIWPLMNLLRSSQLWLKFSKFQRRPSSSSCDIKYLCEMDFQLKRICPAVVRHRTLEKILSQHCSCLVRRKQFISTTDLRSTASFYWKTEIEFACGAGHMESDTNKPPNKYVALANQIAVWKQNRPLGITMPCGFHRAWNLRKCAAASFCSIQTECWSFCPFPLFNHSNSALRCVLHQASINFSPEEGLMALKCLKPTDHSLRKHRMKV